MLLTEDQIVLREEARRFLRERASLDRFRAQLAEGAARDEAAWQTIACELGWCGVTIPEEHGGLGLGAVELALLMQEIGRVLAPVPFWSTVCLGAGLIAGLGTSGAQAGFLPAIASGKESCAVVLPREGVGLRAVPDGDAWRLTGRATGISDLPRAGLILLVVRSAEELALFALKPGEGVEITPRDALDPTRQIGDLALEGALAERLDEGFEEDDLRGALRLARLGLAAEQVGAASACFELTLAYIGERRQFGRTIASFQAIKHRCATLKVDLAEVRSHLHGVAESIERGTDETDRDLDALQVLASEALFRVAAEAIQLHGGAGFTWEYDPHFFLRRAQASAFLLDPGEEALERIADTLLGAPA